MLEAFDKAGLQILAQSELQATEELRGRPHQVEIGLGEALADVAGPPDDRPKRQGADNQQCEDQQGQYRRQQQHEDALRGEHRRRHRRIEQHGKRVAKRLDVAAKHVGDARMPQPRDNVPARICEQADDVEAVRFHEADLNLCQGDVARQDDCGPDGEHDSE